MSCDNSNVYSRFAKYFFTKILKSFQHDTAGFRIAGNAMLIGRSKIDGGYEVLALHGHQWVEEFICVHGGAIGIEGAFSLSFSSKCTSV